MLLSTLGALHTPGKVAHDGLVFFLPATVAAHVVDDTDGPLAQNIVDRRSRDPRGGCPAAYAALPPVNRAIIDWPRRPVCTLR